MDFNEIRAELQSLIKQKYPQFDIQSQQTQISQIIDQVQYLQSHLDEQLEGQFSEVFYDSQTNEENLKSILSLYQYDRRYVIPSFGTVFMYIDLKNFVQDPSKIEYIKINIDKQLFTSKLNPNYFFENVQPYKDFIEKPQFDTLTINLIVQQMNLYESSYTIDTNVEVNVYELYREENSEIILESITGEFIDEFGEKHKIHVQKDFIELYEKQFVEKFEGELYLVQYNETTKKYYLIQQNFFHKPRRRGELYLKYYYSFGQNSIPDANELELIEFIQDIEIMSNTEGMVRKQLTTDDIVYQHDVFYQGKNIEQIDEWIVNQKINRNFGRQITYHDFLRWFDVYIHPLISHFDYSYSVIYNYTYFSNTIIIYIYFYSPISDYKKREIMNYIKQFFEQIVPFGMFILVREQKLVKLTLTGSLSFDVNLTNTTRIYQELMKILYNFNIKFKSRLLQSFDVSLYELQREIYKNIDGIIDLNLQLVQNGIQVPTPIYKVKSDSVVQFDELKNFIQQIKIIPVGTVLR